MSKSQQRDLIENYQNELRRRSSELPPDMREELHEYVSDYLAESLGTSGKDENSVRLALAALGEPSHLVSEMRASSPKVAAAGPEPRSTESSAIRWLTLGSLIPVVGWLYGVLLLWSSKLWSRRDKIIGTLCVPGGVFGVLSFAWMLLDATEVRCTVSSSGTSDGLGGTPTSPPVDVDSGCVLVGAIPPTVGWILIAGVTALYVFGAMWLSQRKPSRG
jgi:hypothetical protein